MDEFNNLGQQDNPDYSEFSPNSENIILGENPDPNEASLQNEYSDGQGQPPKPLTKKQTALSAMTGSLVAIVGAVTVGITSLLNVGMTASIEQFEYEDGLIHYEVSVQEMTEKESLTMYFYEDGVLLESRPLLDEDGDGKIAGVYEVDNQRLAEKLSVSDNVTVKYRVSLKGNVGLNVEREFDSHVVKIDKVTSAFENITGECHCGIDGYYYFTMNYTDDLGVFDNFSAYIEDGFGNRSDCTFSENLHEEQKIYVQTLQGSQATLYVSYTVDGETKVIEQGITL